MSTEVKKDKPSLGRYLTSVKSEIKKVSWPTKQEVLRYTAVVLIMCAFSSIVIGVLDLIFKTGFSFLVK